MALSNQSELKRKTIGAEQAASMVKSGSWLDYGFGAGQPDLFDKGLASRGRELQDLRSPPRASPSRPIPSRITSVISRGTSPASNARCTIAGSAAIFR